MPTSRRSWTGPTAAHGVGHRLGVTPPRRGREREPSRRRWQPLRPCYVRGGSTGRHNRAPRGQQSRRSSGATQKQRVHGPYYESPNAAATFIKVTEQGGRTWTSVEIPRVDGVPIKASAVFLHRRILFRYCPGSNFNAWHATTPISSFSTSSSRS
jgi:hypothetical protein